MTRLSQFVETLKITRPQNDYCMGDVWHNQVIEQTFSDVKSNNFNLDVAKFVDENIGFTTYSNGTTRRNWYDKHMNKTQLKKLNAIMKAKSKDTLQKRVYGFSDIITTGHYSSLFNRDMINSWVEFCNKHNLKHGLVKIDRVKQAQKQLEQALLNF